MINKVLRKCEVPEPLSASEDGRVFSLASGCPRELAQRKDHNSKGCSNYDYNRKQKYLRIQVCTGVRHKHYCVHRLMAVWLPKPRRGQTQIDHINGDLSNNHARNLRWVTPAENIRCAVLLRRLRKVGIDPTMFDQAVLLCLFQRMKRKKRTLSKQRYAALTRKELLQTLVGPRFRVCS